MERRALSLLKRCLLLGATFALVNTVADAQVPGQSLDALVAQVTTPSVTYARVQATGARISDSDQANLRDALAAARSGDRSAYGAAFNALADPDARKIATFAMVDVNAETMSFFELDQARRDLAGWPRGERRQSAAEKALETSGLAPQGIIDWFGSDKPTTAEGAMALAASYLATGRQADAVNLLRTTWRDTVFEADVQRSFLARFGGYLTAEDHIKRADSLLYGPQGPATRDMLDLLPPDYRAVAEARMALRSGVGGDAAVSRVPAALQSDPGLIFARASDLRRKDQITAALALADKMGGAPGHDSGDARSWTERRLLINEALRIQDYRGAYHAAETHGIEGGADAAEAEFYAGWLALSKLNQPAKADEHFARIQAIGRSPITQGRALYWRGRAHEAMGDKAGAQAFYLQGAEHGTTFYGQLAAEKAGVPINLGRDPEITDADRARFEGRDVVRAARILAEAGERDLFKVFVMHLDDDLPPGAEYAQLVDLARGYGDQYTSMFAVRTAAQKGFILPDRGYPMRAEPPATGLETALVFGITRQESGFDPSVRSSADARGMMQLLPSTAQVVARRLGVSYSASQLYDPDYNMRLGATYISQLVGDFSGSYVLGIAGYNAGPGRPRQWVTYCGDPRTGTTDPLDFIECIPFSETRNYVMRVMEGMQVYRAKLNNGVITPTLSADLRRGGYSYAAADGAGSAN
jgi:soluble lytic murein transglycosylase